MKQFSSSQILDDIIYGTFGIHPHETDSNHVTKKIILDKIKINPKIIGIGETGLDFYYNNSNPQKQISSFKSHIEASLDIDIPVIVHSRNAESETFNILNSYKKFNPKILLHCFTGSKELAIKLIELNAYFSSSGIITFKNSTELQETFKIIPNDKLYIADCRLYASTFGIFRSVSPSAHNLKLENLISIIL